MQYPKVKPRELKESKSPGAYADLEELVRLQFQVHGFSFLPKQPVQSLLAGYALLFEGGKPVFHYNFGNVAQYRIAAKDALEPGKHTVVFDFKYDGGGFGKGGTGTLSVDGKEVAQGRIANTIPFRISVDETLDIGEETRTPVSEDYDVPFKFTGTIEKVVVKLGDTKLGAGSWKNSTKNTHSKGRGEMAARGRANLHRRIT